jgi:hypothetical protein
MLQEKMHGGAAAAGQDDKCRDYETIPINDYRKPDAKFDKAHEVFWYVRCRVPENVTDDEIRNTSKTFFYGENGSIVQPNFADAEYYTGGFDRRRENHNQDVVDAIVAKLRAVGGRSRRRHSRSRSKTSKKDKKRSFRRRRSRSSKNKTRKH